MFFDGGRAMNQTPRAIDFVVTGTPRSSTAYLAQVLSHIGFECGHELMFNPWQVRYEDIRSNSRKWGDSSWLAVPFLKELAPATKVFHMVRDPLKAINSIIGTGQLDWPTDYRAFLAFHCWGDGLYWPSDLPAAAQDFWIKWNRMIENSGRVTRRLQVENIGHALREMVTDIQPDYDVNPLRLDEALKAVPTNYNTRPHLTGPVLARSDLKEECVVLARRYGYSY
jgi:hypothetical protein